MTALAEPLEAVLREINSRLCATAVKATEGPSFWRDKLIEDSGQLIAAMARLQGNRAPEEEVILKLGDVLVSASIVALTFDRPWGLLASVQTSQDRLHALAAALERAKS